MLIHLASDEILIDSIFSVSGIYLFSIAGEELFFFFFLVIKKMLNSDSPETNTLCGMRNDSKRIFFLYQYHNGPILFIK